MLKCNNEICTAVSGRVTFLLGIVMEISGFLSLETAGKTGGRVLFTITKGEQGNKRTRKQEFITL